MKLHKLNGPKLSESISNYLMGNSKCMKHENGFCLRVCLEDRYKYCAEINKPGIENTIGDILVKYYQFETVKWQHKTLKTGEKKTSVRCERVNHEDGYKYLFEKLMATRDYYLINDFMFAMTIISRKEFCSPQCMVQFFTLIIARTLQLR